MDKKLLITKTKKNNISTTIYLSRLIELGRSNLLLAISLKIKFLSIVTAIKGQA